MRRRAGLVLAGGFTVSLLIVAAAESGSRDLDPKFGDDGKVVTRFGHGRLDSEQARSVVLQPDGRIVAAGEASVGLDDEWALARYRPSGRLDQSFSRNGRVRTKLGGGAFDLAIQRDGKIVVVGDCGDIVQTCLLRYSRHGTRERTFGDGGKVVTDDIGFPGVVALQPDGKILIAGKGLGGLAVARYNPDGSLDPNFGDGGVALTDFGYRFGELGSDLALQPDGRIVVVGTGITDDREGSGDIIAARYMPDGSLDLTFSDDGKLALPDGQGSGVSLQGDGRILIAADTGPLTVIRLLGDGTLDPSFAEGGVGRYPGTGAADVAELSDGRIVAAGGVLEFALVVLRSDGTLDTSYSEDGATSVDFFGEDNEVGRLAVQRNGKVVVAGRVTKRSDNRFALARFRAP